MVQTLQAVHAEKPTEETWAGDVNSVDKGKPTDVDSVWSRPGAERLVGVMIKDITTSLYDTCYAVEAEVVGHGPALSRFWARANARRHAHTARAILEHAAAGGLKALRVLNASGLSCGHQDFSISAYLRGKLDVEWVVFESPRSPYFARPRFQEMLRGLPIRCELADFAAGAPTLGTGAYDVVLCTEIAEHLELGPFLQLLAAARARLADGGVAIITTPNLAYLVFRLKLLLGNGDLHYWGDGAANLTAGLWGHVVYYDARRLKRILGDAGLAVVRHYTFDYGALQPTVATFVARRLASIIPDAGQTLFVVAAKGPVAEIPLRI